MMASVNGVHPAAHADARCGARAPESIFERGDAVVNRGALLLRYREPAVRWINEADPNPSSSPIDLQSANEERNVYLISDNAGNDRQSLDRWLKRHYAEIFEIELEDWYTDPNLWPKQRSYTLFREWFEPELHTVLIDLGQGAIVDDEASLDGP